MTNKAVKMTGAQVKDLLTRAVGGIYVSRYFDVMTDFYKKYSVTDNGLEIAVNDMLTVKIPIQSEAEYINFAIGCDISECMDSEDTVYEEWESSTYFEYKFEIANLMICFNVTEEDHSLTWEQFRELVANEKYVNYTVRSIDGGSLYVDVNHCNIDFSDIDDSYFSIGSPLSTNIEVDKEIVTAIYNTATDVEEICYQIEFNNGLSDMTIEVEKDSRVF
jgi:hypothetical protein